jgi:hypothetical protein
MAQSEYVNDLYDGNKSIKLENGFPKHDFSSYTIDHYESPKAGAKAGKKAGGKGGKGVPAELKGTGAPQAKAQASPKGMPAELTGTGAPQAKAQTEATPEIEVTAQETISVVQKEANNTVEAKVDIKKSNVSYSTQAAAQVG